MYDFAQFIERFVMGESSPVREIENAGRNFRTVRGSLLPRRVFNSTRTPASVLFYANTESLPITVSEEDFSRLFDSLLCKHDIVRMYTFSE